jgi:hypothetical protein
VLYFEVTAWHKNKIKAEKRLPADFKADVTSSGLVLIRSIAC